MKYGKHPHFSDHKAEQLAAGRERREAEAIRYLARPIREPKRVLVSL